MVVALSDNQNIVFDIFIYDVPRIFAAFFGAANTQPFTLAQRVVHQPLMLTNLITVDGNDFARLCRQVTTKEIAEFALADKTDTGGVFFLRGDQIQLFGDFTHLRLFKLAYREQALRNLFVAECIQEVALIFVAIQTAQQLAFAIHIGTTHVVPGRNIVCAQIFCGEFQEGFKFDLFVAQNVRVRGTTGFVLFQEKLEDVVPVFCSKVNGVQFNAQLIAHRLRIGEIRSSSAIFLAIIFLPVLHEQALHLIALLLQQVGGNGGIDTAGHADDHFFLAVI